MVELDTSSKPALSEQANLGNNKLVELSSQSDNCPYCKLLAYLFRNEVHSRKLLGSALLWGTKENWELLSQTIGRLPEFYRPQKLS